jgi:hypothetical protein
VPDGSNFKVTMQIEYADERQRKAMLARLKGVEDRVWVRIAGFDPVFAIADEDLERENEEKTSAVHFLRFELDRRHGGGRPRSGAAISVGVDHPALHRQHRRPAGRGAGRRWRPTCADQQESALTGRRRGFLGVLRCNTRFPGDPEWQP